jgi:hypothetical protein
MLGFVNDLFWIFWDDCVFLPLISFMCSIISTDLHVVNSVCILALKPAWSWCLLIVLLNWVCKYFIEHFCTLCPSRKLVYNVWVLVCPYHITFGYQGTTSFIEWLHSVLSLSILCYSWKNIGVSSLFKIWYNLEVNLSSSWIFFVGRLYYCFSLIAHCRFKWFMCLWFNFDRSYVIFIWFF